MLIKNLMEDTVSAAIDEIANSESSLSGILRYKNDISAYVLNRIPSKYVTSERGLLHGKLETRFLFQQKTDILFLIHEAIEIFKHRRDVRADYPSDEKGKRDTFFPHIIGEVLEETTFSIVTGVAVSFLRNGTPVPMIDKTWKNPYMTNRGTLGYYHFWPEVDREVMKASEEVTFEIKFNHPKFYEKEIEIKVPVITDFNTSQSKPVQIALLRLREGEQISLIYDNS